MILIKVINNSNILTMGGWIVSVHRAKKICDLWLEAAFAKGIKELEDFSDLLKDAFSEIQKIEEETMK